MKNSFISAIINIARYLYRRKQKRKETRVEAPSAPVTPPHGMPAPITPSAPATKPFFPCIIEGNVNMPDHEARINARNIELITNGHGISGDEARDNAIGGGGSPDGGMYLAGSYHFEIDAIGQRIDDKSWLKLFSDEKFPVTGGITGDGTIAMGSIGGVDIRGSVVGGAPTGKVMHGDGKVHIYGVMSGVWLPQ